MATPDQVVPLIVKAFYEEGEDEKVVSVDMATFQSGDTSWSVEFVGQQSDGEQNRLVFTWDSAEQKGFYQGVEAAGQAEPVDTAELTMSDTRSAAGNTADLSELEQRLNALAAQNELLEKQLAEAAHQKRVAEITNFCEANRSRLTIDPTASDALDFGEGEATSLVDFMASLDDQGLSFMQSFIKALPQQVPAGEVATDFSEPAPTKAPSIAEIRASLNERYSKNLNGGR